MSTVFSPSPRSLGINAANPERDGTSLADGGRSLAALLLAAAVAALVVLADQLIETWADGHLFLGWVALWVVIFSGSVLMAGSARRVAGRTLAALDSWSRSLAEARAEARLWEMAKLDPRLKAELIQARASQDQAAKAATPADIAKEYAEALAPLDMLADRASSSMARAVRRHQAGYLPYL